MGFHLDIPAALRASHATYFDTAAHAWLAALPQLAEDLLDHWELRPEGPATCGAVALVLPVASTDGTPAVLKLQPVDAETGGEPAALRAWAGRGAVRLLRHDAESGAMLLERLDAARSLGTVTDDLAALRTISELLTVLHAAPVPPDLRHLAGITADLLERVPAALATVDAATGRLVSGSAAAVAELLPDSGDRLLHWDLHYHNVLARPDGSDLDDGRGRWLAIDPKPLVGDPGFDLLPALHNRWEDVVATGDVPRAFWRRFDLMTEMLGLDRQRAAGWTLARVLQNLIWQAESGDTSWHSAPDRAVAALLLGNRPRP